jgi:hypothetical protein
MSETLGACLSTSSAARTPTLSRWIPAARFPAPCPAPSCCFTRTACTRAPLTAMYMQRRQGMSSERLRRAGAHGRERPRARALGRRPRPGSARVSRRASSPVCAPAGVSGRAQHRVRQRAHSAGQAEPEHELRHAKGLPRGPGVRVGVCRVCRVACAPRAAAARRSSRRYEARGGHAGHGGQDLGRVGVGLRGDALRLAPGAARAPAPRPLCGKRADVSMRSSTVQCMAVTCRTTSAASAPCRTAAQHFVRKLTNVCWCQHQARPFRSGFQTQACVCFFFPSGTRIKNCPGHGTKQTIHAKNKSLCHL